MSREISEINNDISKVTNAIVEYTNFSNQIVDILNSDITAAKGIAETICDDFAKNYVGNRVEVFTKVNSLNGSVYGIQTNAEMLVESVNTYIGKLKEKLAQLKIEKDTATQSAQ